MKKLLLTSLLFCSMTGAMAQTDMTNKITNPGFEQDLAGWTNDGMQSQGNTSFPLKQGSKYAEKWTDRGGKVNNASLLQELSGLPAGTYTVTAVGQNLQQGTPEAKQTGFYLVAGNAKTTISLPGTYTVTATTADGTLVIGCKTINATGNYVTIDGFTLQLEQPTANTYSAMHTQMQSLITEAEKVVRHDYLPQQQQMDDALKNLKSLMTQDVTEGVPETMQTIKQCMAYMAKHDATLVEMAKVAADAELVTRRDHLDEQKELDEALKALKAMIDSKTTEGADTAMQRVKDAVNGLDAALFAYNIANGTGTAPKVSTHSFIAKGSTAALGRATFSGSNIIEKGFCWATHPEPTVLDNRSTKSYANNGDIYEMSPMEPGTKYYVRAYAITKSYAVGYGEVIRIYTKPKGTSSWSYDYAGDQATNDRIEYAIKHSVELYNAWTSIKGFNINCHYVPGAGAGSGTADCSYGGWMRVSQNVSYQRTGTLLHESNHGVGVGTSSRWWDGNLRANGDRGQWLGTRATEMVRFFDNNTTSILNGDNTHMWPYGINGAHEDDNREITYIANVLITHAVHEDGLAPINGQGASAAYTFEHEDDTKYYITSENPSYGCCTAYLYETSTSTLKMKEAYASDLASDDSYAWYIEFNPTNSYYRLRNAKTGHYMTYSASAFKAVKKTTPGSSEHFQLMGSRENTKLGDGPAALTTKGYWIQEGNGVFEPSVLTATSKTAIGSRRFNIATSATDQRWIILTGDDVNTIERTKTASKDMLAEVVTGIKDMLNVPHTDLVEDATATMKNTVDEVDGRMAQITSSEATSIANELIVAAKTFMENSEPTDINKPYAVRFLIKNADMNVPDYWNTNDKAEPVINSGVMSVTEAQFKLTQTVTAMPKGIYSIDMQAVQCPADVEQTYADWLAGTNNVKSSVYAKLITYKAMFANIMEGAQETSLGGNEKLVGGVYVPADPETAALYFAQGLYHTSVAFKHTSKGDIALNVINSAAKENTGDWSAFGNISMYYYGNSVTKEDVTEATSVQSVENAAAVANDVMYDLTGRRITAPAKGIYLMNGKKYINK